MSYTSTRLVTTLTYGPVGSKWQKITKGESAKQRLKQSGSALGATRIKQAKLAMREAQEYHHTMTSHHSTKVLDRDCEARGHRFARSYAP